MEEREPMSIGANILACRIQIVLLTTANVLADRDDDLRRLVQSVDAFRQNYPDVTVEHRMLLQCCHDIAAACIRFGFPRDMIVTASPTQVPLSVARNMMLDALLATDSLALANALVAFPDDDAWFPPGVLEYIYDRFQTDSRLDFWFCRYGSAAGMPSTIDERPSSLQDAISRASSNTIFLRGRILKTIGGFDESLGLGTTAKSGEDTEFAMRAYFASQEVRHAPYRMIGHRDFDPSIRAKYFPGTVVALGRYAWTSPQACFAFARKILVGCALMIKRELSPFDFLRAGQMYFTNKAAPNSAEALGRPSGVQRPRRSNLKDKRRYA
tara:strand:- start:26375 stop:27352 length:978 start_codon:yes stop_codon:yes gene_type:complete